MFMRTNYQGGVTHPTYKKDNSSISLDNDITFLQLVYSNSNLDFLHLI